MSQQATLKASVPFEYETRNLTISVNVSDLDRSVEWYRDVLGFGIEYRMDDIGWAELTTPFGSVNVGLSQTEEWMFAETTATYPGA
jgi:catechol 2,3-dioxygenase-like lactoylglutathione lyase family enzyme